MDVTDSAQASRLDSAGSPDGWTASSRAGNPQGLRLIIADDHPLFRRGLREAAAMVCGDLRIDEVETLAELHDVLARSDDIALVLLDLRLPDCSGFGGLRQTRERFPIVPVAIVSALEDQLTIRSALEFGAMGFIPKSTRLEELVDGIAAILAGEIWTPPMRDEAPASPSRLLSAGLTPAQMRIVACLQRGMLNKQIAHELGVTEYTVKAHMTAAFRKLGVFNRTQALVLLRDEMRSPA
ncbi:response regulator transcription factor [Sphingomonas sp.]|uniref:response regulator transcription factor n=1 Tax=Sphingomonas sp. TaxID=28214 RepID=UPI0025F5413F|nr:response regulator transcription factor [Sphingomonas sp.]